MTTTELIEVFQDLGLQTNQEHIQDYLDVVNTKENEPYTELHHIIPRSIDKNNKYGTLVSLTPHKHAKAHYYLSLIIKDEKISTNMASSIGLILFRNLDMNEENQEDINELNKVAYEARQKIGKNNTGYVAVKDKDGITQRLKIGDPRLKTDEFVGVASGTVTVKDKNGKNLRVSVDDPKYLSGELTATTKGKITVIDKNGVTFQVDKNDSGYLSGELKGVTKGRVSVIDKNGGTFNVSVDDPRLLSGELEYVSAGRISIHHKKLKKGTMIYKKDLMTYTNQGWELGKFKHQKKGTHKNIGSIWIHKDNIQKKITKNDILMYENEGWVRGCKPRKP